MKRVGIIAMVLGVLASQGCCWRPAWCNQQGYYGQPVYAPQQTYQQPVYQQPAYAPQAGVVQSPCTCYYPPF